MVNLVKAILSTDKSDQKQMKWLKKQLRNNKGDINKVRGMMTPIHAAVIKDNLDVLQQIVNTKGVEVDAACKYEVDGTLNTYGVLDIAVMQEPPSIEIIKILVGLVKNPVISVEFGVPDCVVLAVRHEYLDILDIFRGKACLLEGVNAKQFVELASLAILAEKPLGLSWLLHLPELINCLDKGEVTRGLSNLASSLGKAKANMCEQVKDFLGETQTGLDEDVREYTEAAGVESKKIVDLRTELEENKEQMIVMKETTIKSNREQDKLQMAKSKLLFELAEQLQMAKSKLLFELAEQERLNAEMKKALEVTKSKLEEVKTKNDEVGIREVLNELAIVERRGEDMKRKEEELAALIDLLQEKMLEAQNDHAMKKQSCDLKNEVHNLKVLNKKIDVSFNHLKEQLQIEEKVCGKACEFQKKDENCKNLKESFNEPKRAGDDFIASKIKYCWRCENPSRYMCGGCRKARYCEESCQGKDWGSHKEYCLVKMNKIAFREFESMLPSIFK